MAKIAFIGAGSVTFSRNLLGDILSYPELTDSEIVLVDIDADALERTETVARAMVEEHGFDATVEATTDRREALGGADYVLNMIGVGGDEPFENEVEIPREYGVEQAVGDTLGPGGVFRAMRTLPAMLDIARDMEDVCPDALLLNYTNPMAILCWALDEATDIDVVGLCHSVQHTSEAIAHYAGVDADALDYWVAGINHMAWFLEAEVDGESVYPALHEAADDEETYVADPVRFELMEHFGYFVTESSHHLSEYVPYFRTDPEVIDDLTPPEEYEEGPGGITSSWMPTGEYLEFYRGMKEWQAEQDPEDVDLEVSRSEEYAAQIIHSVETDTRRRVNVNVRNDTDAITNLRSNACVEVPCVVDATGVHPCSVGDLPAQLAALIRTNLNVQEQAVQAGLNRDEDALRRAVKLDPLAGAACTLEEIDAMVDDLLAANAAYLPDFD
ncbi:alpha-galactosidase [Halarchaeum sp. P4]|uniref:alpha-galactosidase n=1 Tax=Halarchaeum sp. P4 TaxID=3421639 RepID=UPI003EBD7975